MEKYDTSWDLDESENGNLPESEEGFERKYQEWQQRHWETWLNEKLDFPFLVERMEDGEQPVTPEMRDRKNAILTFS